MVLSYTTSPAYHLIAEEDSSKAAASFDEGHYMQIEVAGILEGSEHQELARQFLTFLIGNEAQAIMPTTNWTLPVRDDIDLPEAFSNLVKVDEPLLIAPDEVAKNRRVWTDEWLQAVGAR